MSRAVSVVAALLAFVLIGAGAASAQGGRPTIEQFRFTGVDTDASDEISAICGFEITVNVAAHETHILYPDGTEQDLIHYFATYVVGGQPRLIEDDNFRIRSSSADVSVSGQDFRLIAPDGSTILKNAGNLHFEFDTQTLTFHGPHPSITEGVDICGLLTV
jgi:hypothetical protein